MNTNIAAVFQGRKLLSFFLSLTVCGLMLFALPVSAAEGDDIEAQYKEAMYLREQGDLLKAIEAFNSILSNQPELHRARLELAVTYYRARNFAEARANAQKVLDDPKTPVNVQIAINAFLAQLKVEESRFYAERKKWKPSLTVGLLYDDNVNAGPSNAVLPGGLIITPGSLPREDWAATVLGSLEYSWLSDKSMTVGNSTARFFWNTRAQLYHRQYSSENDFNLTVLSAATGPAWASLHNWRANINMQADHITLGSDHLANYLSIQPSVTWQFKNAEATVDLLVQDRNFQRAVDAGRDATYTQLGAYYGRILQNRKVAIQAGARLLNNDADTAHRTYDGYEIFAGVNVTAWQNGAVFGRISRRDTDYDGIEPGFLVARDETEDTYLVGFKHDFKENKLKGWTLRGTYTHTEADSNVGIYTYDRDQVALTLGRDW